MADTLPILAAAVAGSRVPFSCLNVLVGPNNSGKSKFLSDLRGICARPDILLGRSTSKFQWIDSVESGQEIDIDSFQELIRTHIGRSDHGVSVSTSRGGGTVAGLTPRDLDDLSLRRPLSLWIRSTTRLVDLRMQERLSVSGGQKLDRADGPAKSVIAKLHRQPNQLLHLSEIAKQMLGFYLYLDPIDPGEVRLVCSREKWSGDDFQRRTLLSAEEMRFIKSCTPLSEQSDGSRALIGMLAHIEVLDFDMLFIDEPDVYLHPLLARFMGQKLATFAKDQGVQVFVATHSEHFISGVIEANRETSIIRVARSKGSFIASPIESAAVRRVARSPFARASRVLSGLFFDAVVVCEADADRVFYSEVASRVQGGLASRYVEYLNANGIHNIPFLLSPLKEMGVRVGAIVDLDILTDSVAWRSIVSSLAGASAAAALLQQRESFISRLLKASAIAVPSATGPDLGDAESEKPSDKMSSLQGVLQSRGRGAIPLGMLSDFDSLLKHAASHGMFIVGVGVLENWLAEEEFPTEKKAWLRAMMERFEVEPGQDGYLASKDDGVWEFIREVHIWSNETSPR